MPDANLDAAMGDLREFLRQARAANELHIVSGAEQELEIGAIYELSQKELYPPALLFENIVGCDPRFRILCNVRTPHFVVGDLDLHTLREFRNRPRLERAPVPPRLVETGPVFENVVRGDQIDVFRFPAPRWHAGDGGRYIGTECMVIAKDPESDWVNFGTYRVMLSDARTFTVFIEPGKQGDVIRRKWWARGQPCPMAISVGQAPVLGVMAATSVGAGVSEYAAAGARIGRPIDVVTAKATGLPIPGDAELVFEGFMPDPSVETRPEGPFGEWPGYYASDGPQPVMQIATVYHRNDAIVIGQPPTTPNYPGRQVKMASLAALWDALEAAGVPEVHGVWNLQGGGYRLIQVISIKQLHAGHAKMAGLVAAGWGGSYMTRMVIVVDDDIDITNASEVMWAVATRWDPKTQTDIIDGCWTGYIDPRLPPEKRIGDDTTLSRIIIYAVRPFEWKDRFPAANTISRDYADAVRKKWGGQLPFL
ncbi:MAG: UbiD family decarboxylase [Hyphomicrobiales bacterium]|nr:UbiD family decarboxylase [Hyphomicrobiales bacterium]